MNAGFSSEFFQVVTSDGRNFTLIQDVKYTSADGRVFILPAGATTDGASTPPETWPSFPPFGSYWKAAVLHDCAYRNTLLIVNHDGSTSLASLAKQDCDKLLLEAMTVSGTHEFTRTTIYEAVALFGKQAFDSDRQCSQ